jgi:acrylyl-CoA reductase (NADPH)
VLAAATSVAFGAAAEREEPTVFSAVLIEETDGKPRGRLAVLDDERLPGLPVTVDVAYSSLNYKDALAITGAAPIARSLPMVAGIDLAGRVAASDAAGVSVGEAVLVNGCGIGERSFGGLAQRARLDPDWLVPLPTAFTARRAMSIGTAGFTAMLCVLALEDHDVVPGAGSVLVTGAAGGVGSVAVALLAALGHEVIASTGRTAEAEYLRRLGAAEIVDRAELAEPGKALGRERWAAAVDTVGGQTLANVCAGTAYGGTVAACGNAGGMQLPATVAPFILRAVKLIGVDSVRCARPRRLEAWRRLGEQLDIALLDELTAEIGLSEVLAAAERLLAGEVRGRLVVDVNR